MESLLSEISKNSRPWALDEDSTGGLDTIDVTFELFNTPVVFGVPAGLMSSEELECDGIDEETRLLLGWGLLARVKKSVIGFPWAVVAFFVFFVFFAIIITKINGRTNVLVYYERVRLTMLHTTKICT